MNILVWLFTSIRTSMRRFTFTVLTKTSSQRLSFTSKQAGWYESFFRLSQGVSRCGGRRLGIFGNWSAPVPTKSFNGGLSISYCAGTHP